MIGSSIDRQVTGPAPALHPVVRLDKFFSASALAEAWFHSMVIESGFCSSGSWSCQHDGDLRALVPAGFAIRATHSDERGCASVLASASDAVAFIGRVAGSKARVQLSAPSERYVQRWRSVIDGRATIADFPDTVAADFWALGQHGAASSRQSFPAVKFSDISRNYTATTKSHLEDVAAVGAQRNRGGLIIWYGPPGTGKTTAVRAMATEWEEDRELNVITDIERFLQDADYLAAVTRPTEESARRNDRAKLIVAEDVDPSLLAEDRMAADGGLARLLGLTDGLLASATDAIVLLTTNARRHQVAPSLRRPGRCMALVEFGPLSVGEATAWLPRDAPSVTEPATIAELYHRAGLVDRIGSVDAPTAGAGTYL